MQTSAADLRLHLIMLFLEKPVTLVHIQPFLSKTLTIFNTTLYPLCHTLYMYHYTIIMIIIASLSNALS